MFEIVAVIFFLSPIIYSYFIYKGEKEIKKFPFNQVSIKLISSIILLSTNWKKIILDLKDDYYYLIILGFNGVILNSIFICFYFYVLYQNDMNKYLKYNIIIIFGTIILILIFGIFLIQIPFISHLLILFSYTILSLSPYFQCEQIFITNDYKLINTIDLFSIFIFNFNVALIFCLRAFSFINFIVQLNDIISFIELVYYCYLYYQFYIQQKNNQTIDSNANNNKIDEQLITNN